MYTRLSRETAESGKIVIDGVFVSQYLPFAPENYVKVYLLGLSAAQGLTDAPELARIASLLGLEERTVTEAFAYWEENGLVSVHGGDGGYVEYLPVKPLSKQIRKYSKEKFKGFNDQLHALMPNRNFLPNEYNEYYYLMDTLHIEVEAMLMIIGYCIRLKGETIHTAYVLTVARNLAAEGCTTYESVAEKINEYDFQYKELSAVFKALKLKRASEPEDSRLYGKWTKTLSFKSEVVIHVAKNVRRGGMETLDKLLTKYHELGLTSADAVDEYEEGRKAQYAAMNEILRRLGLGYDRVDTLIETYLVKWQSLGFTNDTLYTIADFCLTANMRTLESMNGAVTRFYKKGLLSAAAIDEYAGLGRSVGDLLTAAGVACTMDVNERNTFFKWKQQWNMDDDMLTYAAKKAAGKKYAVSYMDSMLAGFFDGGIKTVQQAEQTKTAPSSYGTPVRTYSAQELEMMFKKMDEDTKLDAAAKLKQQLMDSDPEFYENEKELRLANMKLARGETADISALMKKRKSILASHNLTESDIEP